MSKSLKDEAREEIQGLWICPQVVFDKDFAVDDEAMRTVYEHALTMDIGGMAYAVLMEPWASSLDERRDGARLMLECIAGRVPTYVNVTDHSTANTIALARDAHAHGATFALFNCPYEWAKSQEMALAFYEYVIERVEGKVLLYNTPHSGMILSLDTIDRLADNEKVVGIKDAVSTLGQSVELHRRVGDRMVVSHPFEHHYLDAIATFGQQALMATTACLLLQTPSWQPIRDYEAAARRGDLEEARRLRDEIEPLRRLYLQAYSQVHDLKHAVHPLAVTKRWQGMLGIPGGLVRPPMPQAPPEAVAGIRATLLEFADRFGLDRETLKNA